MTAALAASAAALDAAWPMVEVWVRGWVFGVWCLVFGLVNFSQVKFARSSWRETFLKLISPARLVAWRETTDCNSITPSNKEP